VADLSPEHIALQDLAREFAQGEIAPHCREWNRAKHVSVETLRKMGQLGFFGMLVPENEGGSGLGLLGLCIAMEEIAAADAGTSAGLATQASLGVNPLLSFANADQKQRWLEPFVNGEKLASYALTEPGHGSDTANLLTGAAETDDGYVIDGSKIWITNGGFADVFIVFARSDGPGAKGISAFIVEKDDGVGVSREISKMGLHSSSTVELSFDGVVIPSDRLLGDRGHGLKIALSTLDSGRAVVASQAVGIARAALTVAVDYAAQRNAFGGPIARFQGVQFPIAEVSAKIDAARLLTHEAARTRDAGRSCTEIGAKAKLFASAVAVEAANVAVQTLGGYGYSSEYPAERLYRDAKITQLYEGTSEVQRLVIGRRLFGDAARA